MEVKEPRKKRKYRHKTKVVEPITPSVAVEVEAKPLQADSASSTEAEPEFPTPIKLKKAFNFNLVRLIGGIWLTLAGLLIGYLWITYYQASAFFAIPTLALLEEEHILSSNILAGGMRLARLSSYLK